MLFILKWKNAYNVAKGYEGVQMWLSSISPPEYAVEYTNQGVADFDYDALSALMIVKPN